MEDAKRKGDHWNCERQLENYKSRCSELEERARKSDERCVALELEVEKKNSEFVVLELKFKALEAKMFAKEEQIRILTRRNGEFEKGIFHMEASTNDGEGKCEREDQKEGKNSQVMDAINILEYEKKNAEVEAGNSTRKCQELGERLLCLQKQNLKLRYVKQYLDIKTKVKFHPVKGVADVRNLTNVATPEDGLDSVIIFDEGQNKLKMVDCVHIIDDSSGTPSIINTPKTSAYVEGESTGLHLQNHTKHGTPARKKLSFGEQGTHINKMAPSTPGSAGPRSAGIIDISDSDGESDDIRICSLSPTHRVCGSDQVPSEDYTLKGRQEVISEKRLRSVDHQSDEEDMIGMKDDLLCISIPKRRRTSNVIMSDGDGDIDSDDNIPIVELKNKHLDKMFGRATSSIIPQSLPKRRLVKMAYCEENDGSAGNSDGISRININKYERGIPTNEHELDEVCSESESEGESLGGFIDDTSNSYDISDSIYSSGYSENASDGNLEFGDILCRIQRSKSHKSEWEFEADMLAAFGKDPELCMKAVCALYRQQTSDEKCSREALHQNRRGFSKLDAARGSALAEFLTDGEPGSEVTKSVEELLHYDQNALELCKRLATHYSKQLFEIYKNNEDPLFFPSQK